MQKFHYWHDKLLFNPLVIWKIIVYVLFNLLVDTQLLTVGLVWMTLFFAFSIIYLNEFIVSSKIHAGCFILISQMWMAPL